MLRLGRPDRFLELRRELQVQLRRERGQAIHRGQVALQRPLAKGKSSPQHHKA